MPNSALTPFGTTIFAEISRLASRHGAINLAQGFPDFDGPDHVKDAAIQAIRAGHGQYARTAGLPTLTDAIADWHHDATGHRPDPEASVTVTAGCTEAIAASLLGILNPGDEVVLFEPYYDSYRACVAMAGARARFVTLHPPDFTFDLAELRQAFNHRTRAVLINTPHNPTGRVFSRQELDAIATLCIQHDAVAIADEVYEKLVYQQQTSPLIRITSLPGMSERTITLSSLGKTFSLTGWKIGWAVASPELSRAVRAAHQFLTFAVSTPMQHAAVAALRSPPEYFDNLLASYRHKRDLLLSALTDIGFRARAPEGSYFIYADHTPVSARTGDADDVAFSTRLIERVGVAAIPPSVFYSEPARGSRHLRFAFCKKEETLLAAIDRLKNRL